MSDAQSSPAGTCSRYAARRGVCNARTVLAGKGSLRRAKPRRALAGSAPFWPTRWRDERLRREHFTAYMPHRNLQNLTYTTFGLVDAQ